MGRDSGIVAAAKAAAKEAGGTAVRYCTIPCALRKVLRPSALPLVEHFERGAKSQGLYRHVVSIVANDLVIKSPLCPGQDLFLFYTRVYSAVDRYVRDELSRRRGAATSSAAQSHFDDEVRQFFDDHPLDDEALALLEHQSLVMVRQQECAALATAAHELIELFPQRLRRFAKATITSCATSSGDDVPTGAKMARALDAVVDAILSPSDTTTEAVDPLGASVADALRRFVASERAALGDVGEFRKALKAEKRHFEVLPHLKRLSDASLSMLHDLQLAQPREEVDADAELQDVSDCLPCDEEQGDDGDESSGNRAWTRSRRPKAFALLPIAKLQRSMAYYGWTELHNLYRSLAKRPRGTKRAHDEASCAEAKAEAKAEAAIEEPDRLAFGRQLFDFRKIKGKRHPSWELSCFRTDGIRAVLTFVSGSDETRCAPNVEALVHAGYRIPRPSSPIEPSQERGLFRIQQSRNDAAASKAWEDVELVACDPGFRRPVQFSSCRGTARRTAEALAEQATSWHVDERTWMERSGRRSHADAEGRRRRKNEGYSIALEALCATRRRCSDAQAFGAFASAAMATLAQRARELQDVGRVLCNWKHRRRLQSFLDRVADMAFDRQTCRPSRVSRGYHALENATNRDELLAQLRIARAQKRGEKRVVFFGDGTFASSRRGCPSIPKKRLLKQLGTRGLTFLLDEYNTSKCCPCGQDELKDAGSSHEEGRECERVRVHKTCGGACGVLQRCRDRDALATLNMLQAAVAAVQHHSWPEHLQRSTH
jgi:hypothetical protein